MASVQGLLDELAAGNVSLAAVAKDFAARKWPERKPASDAQAWGVADEDAPAEDSWELVESDSRLTAAQYRALVDAYGKARR